MSAPREAWPDKGELWLAQRLGHAFSQEDYWGRDYVCRCGWRPTSPSSLPRHVQAANHIWKTIRAHEYALERTLGLRKVEDVGELEAIEIASMLGHNVEDEQRNIDGFIYAKPEASCSCGWRRAVALQRWLDHAREVARTALLELAEFDPKGRE